MRWLRRNSARKADGRQGATKAAPRRRKAAPRWVRPTLRAAAAVAAAAAAIGGPVWLWQSGSAAVLAEKGRDALVARSAAMGFTVQEVLLEGRVHEAREAVTRAVGLTRGDPILGFDPAAARARLIALPWVRDAAIERRLPGSVRIRIEERRPLALWQRNGRLALIDDEGAVVTDRNLGAFRHLLIVVGADAPRHAATLVAMLSAEPALARRAEAAVRVGKRRWNVRLSGGVEVRLPETDAHAAWHRLARLDAQHRLLARDLRVIDMRLPDRLIVRTGETGSEARADKGKPT